MQWDRKARRAVVGAVIKGVFPALALAAVGMVLWRWDPQIASLVLLVGSFLLFLMSYRRPWRIRWYTCLLPPILAVGGYLAQVYWFEVDKPIGPMGAGIIVGAVFGLVRGRAHRLEVAKGNVVAHRTVVVLLLWLITYLMTQSSALFGRSELAEWGLTGGAFTTTIVVAFSIVLLLRYRSMRGDLPRPSTRAPKTTALAAGSFLLFAGVTLAATAPPAAAAEPSEVIVDGEWELDRREHHKCQVAVPPVVGGDIHIEADFEAGTIEGWFSGDGAGGYTMPAECEDEEPTQYDYEHLETWSGDFRSIDGVFVGDLDAETGEFEATVLFSIEGDGLRQGPGRQYMCGTNDWTPTCPLPGFAEEIEGAITGVISPTGASDGIVDLYMPYCARVTPGSIAWGIEGCPTIGEWEAGVTSVTWQENRAPEIVGISAVPAEPSSEDTVVITVDAIDPDGDELTYAWFVDGAANSAAGPSVTWAKPEPGDHTIRVTVSDGPDTVEAFLDLRVSEHVGGSDLDDDGVPDDEDLCPQEWGLGDDGCPEFAASVGCAPARPIPEEAVSCAVDVTGKHVGETFLYEWYLDGGNVQSGENPGWTWGEATDGDHEIIVDVTGEGRSATARLNLEVAGGITDAETAGFSVSAIGCNDGISSDEILGCSATISRTRDEVGALAVTWQLGSVTVATELTDGSATGWSLDRPPSGSHRVGLVVIDPLTNLGQAASTTVSIRVGSIELEDAAQAAALATAIGLLLAGSGLATLNNITTALAGLTPEQIEETIRRATDHMPDLIDPRDGAVLETDGDRVYWDDDVGWIDRATAQDWIAELATQRLQRDLETEQTWAQLQRDRDDYYRQREWELEQGPYRWDPDRQAFVHPMWLQRPTAPTIEQVWALQDLIDDNDYLLTDRMQQSVRTHLDSFDFRPGQVDQADFDKLVRLSQAVADSATGQRWSAQVAADLRRIDRLEANMQVRTFLTNFGTGVVRFAVSRIDPTQGLATGALFGYLTAPEGRGVKHAVIGAICTRVDIAASNLAPSYLLIGGRTIQLTGPSHVLWNTATGALIGGAEQGLYTGKWEDIKRGALFGGAANGVFSMLQKPGVQRWIKSVDDSVTTRLGVLEQDLVIRPGTGVTLEAPAATRPAPGVVGEGVVRPTRSPDEPTTRPAAGPDETGVFRPVGAGDESAPMRPSRAPDETGAFRPIDAGDEGSVRTTSEPDAARPIGDADAEGTPAAGPKPAEDAVPTRGQTPDDQAVPQRPGAGVTENTGPAWEARDAALGIQRERLLPSGYADPPEFVKQNPQYVWLTAVDEQIRGIWAEAGGGTDANTWNRVVNTIEQRIQTGDMDAGQVDGWFRMFDESVGATRPTGFVKGTPPPGDLDADLVQGYLNRAIASSDPGDQLAPLANGSRRNLGLWEERGAITPDQAAALNTRASAAVDDAFIRSTPEAMRRFQSATGVRVREALVGDSGSSAGRGARSVGGTDNDRTTVPVFDEADVLGLARDRYPDLPAEQAISRTHQELTQQFAEHQANAAGEYLQSNYGVTLRDLDVGVYNGISNPRPAGPVDLYGAGSVRTRTSVNGRTTVIEPDGSFHRASGDALVDVEHMQRSKYGWADEPTGPYSDIRRMTDADHQVTLNEQVARMQSIDATDPSRPLIDMTAKAVQRAADAGQRLGAPVMDPDLVAVANRLRANPQDAPQILAEAGLTRRTFIERAQSNVTRQAAAVPGP